MAEDDDDEAFGDFAFAPFQSNSQSNADDDDEWGDFVQPAQQSEPSQPFSNRIQSDNSGSPTTWVKPRGVLPLSIFGYDEEDVGKEVGNSDAAVDLNQGKSNGIAGDFNSTKVDNGVTNSRGLSIADLYNQYPRIEPESQGGSDSTGKIDLVENGVHLSANKNDTRSAVTELKTMDLNDTLGTSDHNQLTNKSDNEEFSFKSYVPDPSEKEDLFGDWTREFNGFSASVDSTPQNVQRSSSDIDMNDRKLRLEDSVIAIDDDDDDDGWEFKDAYSESQAQEVNNNVDFMVHEVSERSSGSPGTGNGSQKSHDLFGASNGSIDFFTRPTEPIDYFANSSGISSTSQEADMIGAQPNGSIDFFTRSTEPVDYFANSSGISSTSQEVDMIGTQPNNTTPNGFTLDTHSIIEKNNDIDPFNHRTYVDIEELDEDFGDFTSAFGETGPKPAEVSTDDILSLIKDVVSTPHGEIQEKEMKSNHQRGAIPLSIFGNEEPESGRSSDVQEMIINQSIFEQRHNPTAAKVISINDLISNLYSQSDQTSSINTAGNPTETLDNLSSAVSSSNDDLLDDSSWDFKDASQMIVDGETALSSTRNTYVSISSKLKLNTYLDFYSKLKEELCVVTKCYIESLKQARGNAGLSGEDAGAVPLESELQMVCKELEQMNILSEENTSQDQLSGDSHLNEFAQVLLEPQFQRLESEYHLSNKLLLVENDLGSTMELLRHTNTMLKVLNAGTWEEQKMYVSVWSEMISACTQELKHGASIWNQAVEKHEQSQLLSEPEGRTFVLALGEIYRVVVVLEASAKIFKPWILSCSIDSPAVYILLEECHAVWSTSGLDEALSSVLVDDTSLFKSIKHILGLDAVELQNYVFREKESRCCMSMLTAEVVPDLRMIMWGNEQCFVTLANLWANLISCDPPNLPQLNLG